MEYPNLSVVTKILSKKHFNLGAIKNTLLQAWNICGNVQVNEVEKNTLMFIFQFKANMEKVLKQAPWNFRGYFVVLTLWLDELAF
ncbi:hypothetical protein CDL12_16171 [Handroanthus impetiginosus]|uniref:DUF4283 domain-containing protein n=1 Tax=Handroanthus impetiginosus TaxID=429701 RepID=A0A2G9H127_9LAMI|nr:hypothetical protein CDL12_16171 [Handroanthus impetiginosus]